MRKLLGVLAIVGLAAVFTTSEAEARSCWWNGYSWVCNSRPNARHYWRHQRPHYWNYGYNWNRWHRPRYSAYWRDHRYFR
jgi:hypothetical protein